MLLFDPADPRPVHFMGIAGAGMSALALVARGRGVPVSGCDLDLRDAADVIAAGAQVFTGHDPAHVQDVRAVVHTAAVTPAHPELVAAVRRGVRVVKRAEALGELVAGAVVVGVAGTHGKTTTTAMLTEALAAAGRHPSGLVGGRVAAWGGNARLDGDDLYVVEADEYDKSFLWLRPTIALINNVEADHLECYGGEYQALEDAFVEFAQRAERVILNCDDAGARAVAARLPGPVWTVGLDDRADIRIESREHGRSGTVARIVLPDGRRQTMTLIVPGEHNVRNATMALAAVLALDGDLERAAAGLAEFTGVGRRFEVVGNEGGVTVVDDYAHHPSEISVTLAAARERFPGRRLIAVFQPHLFSRTQQHSEALGRALAAADVAVVTEIYPAREQPIEGVNGRLVASAAQAHGVDVTFVPRETDIVPHLRQVVTPGDVVVVLGAGSITVVARQLPAALAEAAA